MAKLANDTSLWERVTGATNRFVDTDNGWHKAMQQFSKVLAAYQRDQKELVARIAVFEKEFVDAKAARREKDSVEARVAKQPEVPGTKKTLSVFDWIRGFFK